MSLYRELLGEQYERLPACVRRLHDPGPRLRATGRCAVTRGTSLPARLLGWLMRFPPAGADLPLRFEIETRGDAEHWHRMFGFSPLRSVFSLRNGYLREQMGPLCLEQSLELRGAELWLLPRRAWLLGLPLPSWLTPRVRAVAAEECAEQGPRYVFDVAAGLPMVGEVVRYRGWLKTDPIGG